MINNSSKTERFLKAINSDADARCERIKNDVDEYIENEIKKTRRLARQNVRPVRSSEFDRLNEEINAELSENNGCYQLSSGIQIPDSENRITVKLAH